jgi:hypothetical protein
MNSTVSTNGVFRKEMVLEHSIPANPLPYFIGFLSPRLRGVFGTPTCRGAPASADAKGCRSPFATPVDRCLIARFVRFRNMRGKNKFSLHPPCQRLAGLIAISLPNLTPFTAQFASNRSLGLSLCTMTPSKLSQLGSVFLTASVIADCKRSRENRTAVVRRFPLRKPSQNGVSPNKIWLSMRVL